ncbi:hypothetical protein HDV01_003625, partial [Terramyces sp. JEL0728]
MSLIQRLQVALEKLDPKSQTPPPPAIPKFYRRDYYDESILPLRKAVYQHKKSRRDGYIATSQELEDTWDLFKLNYDSIINATSKDPKYYISYKKFKGMRSHVLPKLLPYFTAKHFLGFKQTDKNLYLKQVGVANVDLLMEGYDALSDYGQTVDGYVTEDELQLYIEDLIPSLCLRPQSAQFRKFYLCNCVKKFTFFLDKNRNGRMKIINIVLSPIFVELMELKDLSLSQELQDNNWFSTSVSMRVYGDFIRMDTDKNGMLSRKELTRYRNGNLTRAFLDRAFAEIQTYGGEMDYMGYLDFVLAIENLDTPEAMAAIFPILDVKKDGFLDESTISYFVKDVVIRMFAANLEAIPKSDVVNEIFDMVNPKVKHYITLKVDQSDDAEKSPTGNMDTGVVVLRLEAEPDQVEITTNDPPPSYEETEPSDETKTEKATPENVVGETGPPGETVVEIAAEGASVDIPRDPPHFEEAMRPENQSHKVRGVALLLLPFYILFYEIPVWIWTVMLPSIGRFLKRFILLPIWTGIKAIGRGIAWLGIQLFAWIIMPILTVLKYIAFGILFILEKLVDGISFVVVNIWKGLCFVGSGVKKYILLPLWGGITFIAERIWFGIKWVSKGIFDYILVPIGAVIVYI